MLGIATGNWAGTSSLYLDPAGIAGSRQRTVIDVLALNAFVENDLGTINNRTLFSQLNSRELLKVNDVFKFNGRSQVNLMLPYAEVRGPGFLWSIDHKNTIGITTRLRGANQFTGVNEKIYRTVLDPTYATTNGDYTTTSRNFKWNAATWGEIGFSYARVLVDEGENFLSLGGTVRYLAAAAYVSMQGNNVNATYYAAQDSLRISNANIEFSSNVAHSYRRVDATTEANSSPSMFSRYFGKQGGSGIGGDIGFHYEFRPNPEQYLYEPIDSRGKKRIKDHSAVQYKLRISAAVTDIGSMRFANGVNRKAVATGNGYIIGSKVGDNVNNYRNFTSYARQQGFDVDTMRQDAVYYLPTTMVLGIDYKIWRNFYINGTSLINVAGKERTGNYFYDQVTVTPRFDKDILSIAIPITYNIYSESFKAGLGLRVGGFFIGGDDLLGLISNNQYGVNIYTGLAVPINYAKPRDRDHDRITDRNDKCPDTPGIWEFHGCPDPDRDKDGIANAQDRCPDVAGSPTAQGCPDRDKDGVTDATDRCPDVPGIAALAGCPDTDKDGIADGEDACPDVPGIAAFKGCPDTDGDGLQDNMDKCPTKAGPIALGGCPDTDMDGLADNVDRCPNKPGPASNYGCPEVRVEVIKRLSHAATALEFETGKAVIKVSSYSMLDDIVKLLNEYSDHYMDIEGHTDNVGSDASNLILSEERAGAVKEYFINKGVAPDRLVVRGMGESMPVAGNNTAAGRAQNRRVKMTLKVRGQ
ncbi:DUF5723 family protein [Nemorincola caseinilytica]|uniref:DUF5723 family protein n=1 Tax=Nemorincola caseinilytica TaxID=2054315 RepID=A0ABP8NDR1_9BACT